MSIHPTLAISLKDQKQRSVLKRMERIKLMREKGEWEDERSVFGLPKVKTIRLKMKIKKEKVVDATVAAEGAAPTPEQAATAKTTSAPVKGSAAAPAKTAAPTAKAQAKPAK